ncbi:MAG: IS256 family transposase [Nannocystaceae bacterium]
MTHQQDRINLDSALEAISSKGLDGMADAIRILVNEAMLLERSSFLGAASYERTEDRRGHSNGFKPKTVDTRVGTIQFDVPQVRDVADGEVFYPSSLERGVRSERALKLAIAEMYVNGVSTRKVAAITEELCGVNVTSTQVSRAAALLDDELQQWRARPLGRYSYLLLDARYEKVRHGGSVSSAAVLTAIGVDELGFRSVLGVSVSRSEAEVHWRSFLDELRQRGLHGMKMITSDDHAGLKQARVAVFPGVPWNRCQFHLQRNAVGYVPRVSMREEVARDLRSIFNAPTRPDADRLLERFVDKYQIDAPQLAEWAIENVPEGLEVLVLPVKHQRRLRTTNMVERLNRELLRRTRVATLFPNDASLLRLVTAVVMEITEDWETGRRYLSMDAE